MADNETPPVQPARRVVTTKRKAPTDRQAKATPAKAAKPAPIIDIEDEEVPIPVRLIGKDYEAHRPKAMLAIRLGERVQNVDLEDTEEAIAAITSFLRLVFDTQTSEAIMARLEDPDDRLDVHHLLTFVDRMTEAVTGRPPTSPPASAN
ncbi:tail assembly chaperone [Microbacterium phage Nicole72]|uniref:Tail assembly chaperone n=1 Tax=Microbacterium phage Nicole72 TaxID=3062838 RepID=A0ACD4UHH6_9CAUD|nr:tail assembly chaperone [Microbacterium phage Nicole72]